MSGDAFLILWFFGFCSIYFLQSILTKINEISGLKDEVLKLKTENINLLESGSAALKVLQVFLQSNFAKEGYARIWMHDKLWTFRINEVSGMVDISISESEDDPDYYKPENDFIN